MKKLLKLFLPIFKKTLITLIGKYDDEAINYAVLQVNRMHLELSGEEQENVVKVVATAFEKIIIDKIENI